VATGAQDVASAEREWWLRIPLVLYRPRAVFEALRDDSTEGAAARQEPLTAIALLAGISIFLSTGTAASLVARYENFDTLRIVVEAVVAGMLVGLQNFWILGGMLAVGILAAEGTTTYRQARHLIGFATTPFIASLVLVWPIRLVIYGSDLFRSGGGDSSTGALVFRGIDAAVLAWSLGLIVYGLRTLEGWSWRRSFVALSIAAIVPAVVVAALTIHSLK
jgi:hypothetical protein